MRLFLFIPQVLRKDGHQCLLVGLLQRRHPVGLADDHVLKAVAHIPAVAEVVAPLFIQLIKEDAGLCLGLLGELISVFLSLF